MSRPLAVGDVVRARGRVVIGDAGARLLVPPDDEMSRWFGLDLDGVVAPAAQIVDVIGEWKPDERIAVHRFEPVVDEDARPGDDAASWRFPGYPADVPSDLDDILDQLSPDLDIQWVKYSVSGDGASGW